MVDIFTVTSPPSPYTLSFDLGKLIRHGDVLRVSQWLKSPLFDPYEFNKSPVDHRKPPEVDRSDIESKLLLSCCVLSDDKDGLLSFCLLLERGANPDARGVDQGFAEWEFVEGRHDEFSVELERARDAKYSRGKYEMPSELRKKISDLEERDARLQALHMKTAGRGRPRAGDLDGTPPPAVETRKRAADPSERVPELDNSKRRKTLQRKLSATIKAPILDLDSYQPVLQEDQPFVEASRLPWWITHAIISHFFENGPSVFHNLTKTQLLGKTKDQIEGYYPAALVEPAPIPLKVSLFGVGADQGGERGTSLSGSRPTARA